ncbi:hypothetical protein GL263_20320 [Streptomyces durbertensis]|uniref:Uncharacterized protein n=1 Tax=Streptomyces durbertensis TaxID=2448886 RepID=A0ABR6EKN3_9ACTN|nr:hypothetical protein [Streptomyces durbertensis]MBB1245877.1 hypothetical protein [Streptomyces durbertensis]
MRKRKIAGIAFGALFFAASAPGVAFVMDYAPEWVFGVFMFGSLLLGHKYYRLVWVDDLGDFGLPVEETLTVEDIERNAAKIQNLLSLITERDFSEGRYSLGYRREDVDDFLRRLAVYLDQGGPAISTSWIRRKQFPWAVRGAGYRQEDVQILLARIANDIDYIIASGARDSR